MKKLRCKVSIANLMKMPDHKAELHTQILYGDAVTVSEHHGSQWIKIVSEDQQTSGWVLQSQFEAEEKDAAGAHILSGHYSFLSKQNAQIPLVSGTFIDTGEQVTLMQDSQLLTKEEITFSLPLKMRILNSYLNAPYLWGGCSVYGIDCSGLSKMFYRFFDLPLPHLAAAQMEMGTVLDFISNAVCGDLAFFENEQQEINHVGILLNDHEIIHASESNGRVTSDLIDHQGIINRVTGKRTHQLRIIKRLYEVAQG